VNILISIARMKVLAVLLGPSGVGLLSIYNSLQAMVKQTAGLGMGSSSVRQLASSRGEEATLSRERRVLFAAHLVQGALAMLAVWLLRAPIATWLFGDAHRATEVGLIGIAILLTLLGTAQTALLQGLRRIADLGRVTVIAAFTGTVAGLVAVWLQGESGLIWFILVQPLTYVGFLLGAMGADYYPRLTEVIHDHVAAVRLMNDQAQLSLAIGGPVLLLLIGLAPWVITLLYSAEFGPAVTLLQWQTVGNVFKLASWAMSFSIVAAARAKTYFFMELSFNIIFLGLVLLLLSRVGLEVTAYAFVIGYLVYLTTVYMLARRIHGFRFQPLSFGLLGLHARSGIIRSPVPITSDQ
jgi:O-antigen/teichoic acid export membrane protein